MEENKDRRTANVRQKAKEAPETPGVYIWKNEKDAILYVGKAKSLKARLTSYFSGKRDIKTTHLVSKAASLDWILTENEYEALLLENNLIKEHSPRYNVNLKDGKTYPSVRVTNEEFPRIFRTRRIVHDGSRYFGPYPSADAIDRYLDLIRRLFPLRRCKTLKKRKTPCMYFHIGRCCAPCAGTISAADYAVHIECAADLLSGKTDILRRGIENDMAQAAAGLQFEKAAELRDALRAIDEFRGESAVVDYADDDPCHNRDYVAWAFDATLASFVVFQTRGGKLVGRDLFRERCFGTEMETAAEFFMAYYGEAHEAPPEIFVKKTEGLDLAAAWLSRERGARFVLREASEKRHAAALAMAEYNAKEDIGKRRRETGDIEALEALRAALNLDALPEIIEGFDIAQLSGTNTVASLVSFRNGIPDKKNYRIYKIKSLAGAIDDFEAMREAAARRYSRLANEGGELPDLILIDGGRGQVNAVFGILNALGLDIPLVGLAKENEELWPHGVHRPVVLPKDSPALRLLVAARDEAHRFATGMNQRLRGKGVRFAVLQNIEGVGPIKARKIMDDFGSLEAVAEAAPEYIAKASGLNLETAVCVQSAARAARQP